MQKSCTSQFLNGTVLVLHTPSKYKCSNIYIAKIKCIPKRHDWKYNNKVYKISFKLLIKWLDNSFIKPKTAENLGYTQRTSEQSDS